MSSSTAKNVTMAGKAARPARVHTPFRRRTATPVLPLSFCRRVRCKFDPPGRDNNVEFHCDVANLQVGSSLALQTMQPLPHASNRALAAP